MNRLDKIAEEYFKKGELGKSFNEIEDVVATFDYYTLPNGQMKTFSGLLEFYKNKTNDIPENVEAIDFFQREESRVVIKFKKKDQIKTLKLPVIHHIRCVVDSDGLITMFIDRRRM
jgi:hypothetical protein